MKHRLLLILLLLTGLSPAALNRFTNLDTNTQGGGLGLYLYPIKSIQ